MAFFKCAYCKQIQNQDEVNCASPWDDLSEPLCCEDCVADYMEDECEAKADAEADQWREA